MRVVNETDWRVPRARMLSVARRADKLFQFPRWTHVDVTIVRDRTIRELNRRTRGENTATDVLAFPLHAPSAVRRRLRDADGAWRLGDVVISAETARRTARGRRIVVGQLIAELFAHGLLHLLGYDHQTRGEEAHMQYLTNRLLGVRAGWRRFS